VQPLRLPLVGVVWPERAMLPAHGDTQHSFRLDSNPVLRARAGRHSKKSALRSLPDWLLEMDGGESRARRRRRRRSWIHGTNLGSRPWLNHYRSYQTEADPNRRSLAGMQSDSNSLRAAV